MPNELIYLDGDSVRLAQVFGNLLTNASKFTPDDGQIMISTERHGNNVEVKIKDSGVGIPAQKLAALFEMFTQLGHPLKNSQGGLGIGLSLVKRLVELHGGSVTAKSAGEGLGSEFAVMLPILTGKPVEDEPKPNSQDTRTSSGKCELVVDDTRIRLPVLQCFSNLPAMRPRPQIMGKWH